MAVLLLVVVVLAASYASSLKAYLQQRHDIESLKAQIVAREKAINALQDQKDRWSDPAYLEQQAREQFGFVMPGEKAYVALDAQGRPIKPSGKLSSPDSVGKPTKPTAWWTDVWSSDVLAGHPPKATGTPPATKISPPPAQDPSTSTDQ
jgi:cell division protein FtsL